MSCNYLDNFKDGYYKINLNCDDDFFRNELKDNNILYDRGILYYGNSDDMQYNSYIYCKLIDGKLYDVITNYQYKYSMDSIGKMSSDITFWSVTHVKSSTIYNSLKDMDDDNIKCYCDALNLFKDLAKKRYLFECEEEKKRELLNKEKEVRESKYREYINNYYFNNIKDKYTKGYFSNINYNDNRSIYKLDSDYYMVFLNNNFNMDNQSMVDNNLYIYCKNINGRLYDIITNDEYSYSSRNNSMKYSYITYRSAISCDVNDVYEQLSNMSELDLCKYINSISRFKFNAYKDNTGYLESIRINKILTDLEKDKEVFYNKYIDEFHNLCKIKKKIR